jgi:hypothetical protein
MLQIISHIDEYTQTDLKQLEIMINLATKKGYLIPREKGWFLQSIRRGESIGVKTNGLLVGNSMLSSVIFPNGRLNGIMYGTVWREKYNGGELIFSETFRIAKDRFDTTYAAIAKSNQKSLCLFEHYGGCVIEDVDSVEPLILINAVYDEKDGCVLLSCNR